MLKVHWKTKNEALRTSMGNFDIKIKQLSSASLSELKWRQSHIIPANLSTKPTRNIYCIINTDASESGWGVHSCVASIGEASPMTTLPH